MRPSLLRYLYPTFWACLPCNIFRTFVWKWDWFVMHICWNTQSSTVFQLFVSRYWLVNWLVVLWSGLFSLTFKLVNKVCYWDTFLSAPTSHTTCITIYLRWLAKPYHPHSHLPHNTWSSYEHLSLWKQIFFCSLTGHIGAPNLCSL